MHKKIINYCSITILLALSISCNCLWAEKQSQSKIKKNYYFNKINDNSLLIPYYVWNLGFGIASDITPFKNGLPLDYSTGPTHPTIYPQKYIKNFKKNDIIWVQSFLLHSFYQDILPYVNKKFILVVNDGDESFPSYHRQLFNVDQLINDDRVIHIFAQNVDCKHKKITHLPIGIDFHSIARTPGYFGQLQATPQQQSAMLDQLLSTLLPTNKRIRKAYVDFQLADRGIFEGESRTSIFFNIINSGVIDAAPHYLPRQDLWEEKGKYAFSVSPRGAGLDCHRTWEDLVLGCIVIVKTSALDPMYNGLPVVIIDDWNEINKTNLKRWLIEYGDVFNNPDFREKLTHRYWMNLIRSYQKPTEP